MLAMDVVIKDALQNVHVLELSNVNVIPGAFLGHHVYIVLLYMS